MRTVCLVTASLVLASSYTSAEDLSPDYTPHEPTADERLQNFRPPPPAPDGSGVPTELNLGHNTTLSPGTGSRQGGYGVHVTHKY